MYKDLQAPQRAEVTALAFNKSVITVYFALISECDLHMTESSNMQSATINLCHSKKKSSFQPYCLCTALAPGSPTWTQEKKNMF